MSKILTDEIIPSLKAKQTPTFVKGEGVLNSEIATKGNCEYAKYGRIVTVFVDNLVIKSALSGITPLFYGLPAPATNAIFTLGPGSGSSSNSPSTTRTSVRSDGTLNYQYGGMTLNTLYCGSVTYIAAE